MHRDPSAADTCSTDPAAGACAPELGAGLGAELGAAKPPSTVAGGGRCVWLRANGRPAGLIAGLAIAGGLVLVVFTRPWSRPVDSAPWLGGAGLLAVGAGLALATLRPRLVLDRESLRVHLAPGRIERVPLDVVECFFLGSRLEPPPPGDDSTGGSRVRTLVMRIAERSVDHAARPTLPLWGAWSEGSVTFDGRWCEPLSVDLVRRLNRDLATAKRTARAGHVARGEAT